jgi:hypothetical protein
MNPTKEEIKEFWERCGAKYIDDYRGEGFLFPDGLYYSLPELSFFNGIKMLGLLFKYAVPELKGFYQITFGKVAQTGRWAVELQLVGEGKKYTYTADGDSPAIALFRAIQEVVNAN